MTALSTPAPGGLVAALHASLRAHARQRPNPWASVLRFLPHLAPRWEEALDAALARVRAEAPEEAALLRARFWQGRAVQSLAFEHHLAPSTLYARQRRGIQRLAAHLWALEQEARQQAQAARAHKGRHLPPATASRLFGVEPVLARLRDWLLPDDGPRWVLVEGLGGLGKTTLAHAFAQQHLDHWRDVAWVDAHTHRRTWEHDTPPLDANALLERVTWQLLGPQAAAQPPPRRDEALRVFLARARCLVVLDDLLPADIGRVLQVLPPPPAQSRFLITTRYRYPEPGAHLPLRELSQDASLALLNYEIQQRGLPPLPRQALEALYQRVGGNPLALKLTVGQLAFLPLERVLERLPDLPVGLSEDLFAYIYEPLLQHLPPHARQVLEAMPYFAPQGATYEELQAVTGLPHARLDDALYRLMFHALLDLDPRPPARYFIHRLTYVYLTQHLTQPA